MINNSNGKVGKMRSQIKKLLFKLTFAPECSVRQLILKAVFKIKYRTDNVRLVKANYMTYMMYWNDLVHVIYKKFRREIHNIKDCIDNEHDQLPHAHDKIIWICWFQGIENAPDLVKVCVQSLYQHLSGGYDIRLITNENYKQYVDMPQFIIEKFENKTITPALFSDLLRLELLNRYGGTWMDATILCTNDNIPKFMMESDLFLFTATDLRLNATPVQNYYISAHQNNKILRLTYEIMLAYLKKYDMIPNYHFFYNCFAIAAELYPDEWYKVTKFPVESTLLLGNCVFDPYDEEKYLEATQLSPFQKLNHRVEIRPGSMLEHIITNGKKYGED